MAEERRSHRDNAVNLRAEMSKRPQCNQVCASEFGLLGHLHSYTTLHSRPSEQPNVFIELDELLQTSTQERVKKQQRVKKY